MSKEGDAPPVVASKKVEFLNFRIDLENMCFMLPVGKVATIRDAIANVLAHPAPTTKMLAQVAGQTACYMD